MQRVRVAILAAVVGVAATGCAFLRSPGGDEHADHAHPKVPRRVVPEGAGAPLFNDLGDHGRAITTASGLAQQYFDQGLVLAYGFNHAEAERSFREAAAQDPGCAICWWGVAYVLGPNINKPMDDADVPRAWQALQQAQALSAGASPVEQDLIAALAARYAPEPVADRSALDRAYAEAMAEVAAAHPGDLDVQTLYAEALMDTMPWDYYVDEDPARPKPDTLEVTRVLESVMERAPEHPGALHFYIHTVEASATPERAEPVADRLRGLVPGAGHLVHMPAHIYLRIGRYHDASQVNVDAAGADESYISQCRAQGFYPALYYPHNIHFLYAAAGFEGRSQVSIDAARKLAANIPMEFVREVPLVEEFLAIELYALARFGRWPELLARPAPDPSLRYVTGVWHYTRGMAHAASGAPERAASALATLREIAREPALVRLEFASLATPAQLLTLGAKVLEGRIAGERGDWEAAAVVLREAVALEDALRYTEPPPWYFPVREALGHALLEAGRAAEAEAAFRDQLELTPRNGWSLRGLELSLRAQGRDEAADQAGARFQEAWQLADVELVGPVF